MDTIGARVRSIIGTEISFKATLYQPSITEWAAVRIILFTVLSILR